jgi:hypothetical protein
MPRERLKHAVTRGLFVRAIYSDLGRALTLAGASACLLLPLLSQPLWRDEGSTFIDVSQPNVAGVLDSIRVNELTPPLYFLLEHLWINFAGTTEFALRFPSLVAIALAIGLLYDTARRVRDRVAGYATAGCAGLAPLSLLVGSEARAYALTLLLGALVMWLVARLFLTPLADVHAGAAGLALATAAICWVNYTAWPAVAALLIIAPAICMAESSRRALLLFVALAAGAAATLPIIPDPPVLNGEHSPRSVRPQRGQDTPRHRIPICLVQSPPDPWVRNSPSPRGCDHRLGHRLATIFAKTHSHSGRSVSHRLSWATHRRRSGKHQTVFPRLSPRLLCAVTMAHLWNLLLALHDVATPTRWSLDIVTLAHARLPCARSNNDPHGSYLSPALHISTSVPTRKSTGIS